MAVYSKIKESISNLKTESISENRKETLNDLANYIQEKVDGNNEIRLNFICTHNSRRSHLSQIWAQAMAHYFSVSQVFSYSSGTEATALFPMIIETLESSGFQIDIVSQGINPVYCIKFAKNQHPVIGFSKTIENDFNPKTDFAALMTCSQANEACPFIAGAENRFSLNFEDPKVFDNTDLQKEKYLERSLDIASEMYYVFSQIKN